MRLWGGFRWGGGGHNGRDHQNVDSLHPHQNTSALARAERKPWTRNKPGRVMHKARAGCSLRNYHQDGKRCTSVAGGARGGLNQSSGTQTPERERRKVNHRKQQQAERRVKTRPASAAAANRQAQASERQGNRPQTKQRGLAASNDPSASKAAQGKRTTKTPARPRSAKNGPQAPTGATRRVQQARGSGQQQRQARQQGTRRGQGQRGAKQRPQAQQLSCRVNRPASAAATTGKRQGQRPTQRGQQGHDPRHSRIKASTVTTRGAGSRESLGGSDSVARP